jgi:RimJ/RimL family protein N-acetyltransferase
MCSDVEVMRYIGNGRVLTRDEAWQQMATILGHWTLRGYGIWALEHKKTGETIGRIGFWNPEGWLGFELTWLLARECWGQGFAEEGARAAIHYAATALARNNVVSIIHPDNARSLRLASKLGLKPDGTISLRSSTFLVYRAQIERDS